MTRRLNLRDLITETEWQTQVVTYARLRGWLVHHTRPARKLDGSWSTPLEGDPGFPDLVLAKDGRVLFVELKTERGRVSPTQQVWHQAIGENFDGTGLVFRPSDWDTLRDMLDDGNR